MLRFLQMTQSVTQMPVALRTLLHGIPSRKVRIAVIKYCKKEYIIGALNFRLEPKITPVAAIYLVL